VLDVFGVLDAGGNVALKTQADHHCDTVTGYDLVTITQTNEDGSSDMVCLHRHQLITLASKVKGN